MDDYCMRVTQNETSILVKDNLTVSEDGGTSWSKQHDFNMMDILGVYFDQSLPLTFDRYSVIRDHFRFRATNIKKRMWPLYIITCSFKPENYTQDQFETILEGIGDDECIRTPDGKSMDVQMWLSVKWQHHQCMSQFH